MTPDGGLTFATRTTGPNEIIELHGELDLASAPALRAQLMVTLRDRHPERLILDLAGLNFIDSTGLSVLVWAHRHLAERGGLLCITTPRAQVTMVLRVTGLHERLHLHQTVEEALAVPSPVHAPAGRAPAIGMAGVSATADPTR